MKVTRFACKRDLIVVRTWVWSLRSRRPLRLVVDTGSSDTVVTPEIIDDLGNSPRDGERVMTTIRSAIGREQGWTLRVRRFSALGFVIPDYHIDVFDLATGDDIDGLIGLSFLKQFNCEFRFAEGRIRVERAAVDAR